MSNAIAKRIDILEDDIFYIDPALLKLLLKDKTTGGYILWATKDYEKNGIGFDEHSQIYPSLITGIFATTIQPRAAKSKAIQNMRVRSRAEVFTPSWVCNEQNNLIDEGWFGRPNVFNTPQGTSWKTNKEKIQFELDGEKTWQHYVDTRRLEITCGEAPYLVSRYDTTTGELIPVYERIGLLDRKLRVVNENCQTDEEWELWTERAIQSVYGYEFQGDSVLIARENVLYTYIDFYKARFGVEPNITKQKQIANSIVWNIWQMDGLKCVVPYSCHETEMEAEQLDIAYDENLDRTKVPCPGCAKNDMFAHNGIYCRIYDWRGVKKSIPFISLLNGGNK